MSNYQNRDIRRASNTPRDAPGGPNAFRNFRRENVRFGVNAKGRSKNALVIDEHIQEATPEHLRIEIDKIFAEFLADPEKTEYIFPSDFNNLQRKYVHYKAQLNNLVSKSHGKEPNRQLHLKKKPKQAASQSFQVFLCDEIYEELREFIEKSGDKYDKEPQHLRLVKRNEKVYGRLQDTEPTVPPGIVVSSEVAQIRTNLPIFDKRAGVLDVIHNNQVTIICSETGSGKTTQIPQYLLEDAHMSQSPCKIICTQPRRISTIAAAERVSFERGESVGGTVGYHIRLESKCGPNTNLLFCTVGVFLRSLMCGNKCLNNISYIIVDEIHERDKLSDFLLICLRQNLPFFPNLKVILMSATVDTTKFQTYFNSSAVLSIPGRLHPIQTFFLEDVLSMTQFMTGHMRTAMVKLQQKRDQEMSQNVAAGIEKPKLSEQDQMNVNLALEAYMNYRDDYDYTVYYDEATADLMQLFISEDVPVDQQHSERGWTALMIACHLGDLEFISKLFTLGASLEICDAFGKTAHDYAENRRDVIELLNSLSEQGNKEKPAVDADNSQFLLQLYDMTTPDDFIDYDLISELIKYIHANSDRGSILVFLPGYDEIMQCNDNILDSGLPTSEYRIFFLHSSMNMKDQCDVFKRLNQRKLILSTNIAETSITVEDVVFVIDVGKAKEKVYDAYNKMSVLQTQWISRACAKQRQGRAGRVQTGFCFRLYSQQRFNHMPEERVPEILRVSLEELCLHAKIIAPKSMNIYNFLCLAPDPPTPNAVQVAVENLQALGALDKEEDLNRLGEYLAQLTLEPRLGKMLILACIFKCLEPMLTICAAMAHRDPFQLPAQAHLKTHAGLKRRELLGSVPSDHAAYLIVFQKWQEEVSRGHSRQFCHEYFISETTMYSVLDTRRQLLGQLRAVGFVNNNHSIEDFNHNSNSWGLVKAIMCAAFFPNVAYPVQRGLALNTINEKKVSIHNTSICQAKKYEHWTFYDEMVRNRVTFMIRGVTVCSSLMVAIMCGIDIHYPSSHSFVIDEWLEFYFGDILAVKFRKCVHNLVARSLNNPFYASERSNLPITETLRKIMDADENNYNLPQPRTVGARPKFLYKLGQETNGRSRFGDHWDSHRKVNTPRRFVPQTFASFSGRGRGGGASRNLRFDNLGEASNAVTQSLGAMSVSQPGPSTSSNPLGLGPQNVPFYPQQQQGRSYNFHNQRQNGGQNHLNGNWRQQQPNSGNSDTVPESENVLERNVTSQETVSDQPDLVENRSVLTVFRNRNLFESSDAYQPQNAQSCPPPDPRSFVGAELTNQIYQSNSESIPNQPIPMANCTQTSGELLQLEASVAPDSTEDNARSEVQNSQNPGWMENMESLRSIWGAPESVMVPDSTQSNAAVESALMNQNSALVNPNCCGGQAGLFRISHNGMELFHQSLSEALMRCNSTHATVEFLRQPQHQSGLLNIPNSSHTGVALFHQGLPESLLRSNSTQDQLMALNSAAAANQLNPMSSNCTQANVELSFQQFNQGQSKFLRMFNSTQTNVQQAQAGLTMPGSSQNNVGSVNQGHQPVEPFYEDQARVDARSLQQECTVPNSVPTNSESFQQGSSAAESFLPDQGQFLSLMNSNQTNPVESFQRNQPGPSRVHVASIQPPPGFRPIEAIQQTQPRVRSNLMVEPSQDQLGLQVNSRFNSAQANVELLSADQFHPRLLTRNNLTRADLASFNQDQLSLMSAHNPMEFHQRPTTRPNSTLSEVNVESAHQGRPRPITRSDSFQGTAEHHLSQPGPSNAAQGYEETNCDEVKVASAPPKRGFSGNPNYLRAFPGIRYMPRVQSASAELVRCLQYPDDPVFLFIKAQEKKNIDIAQSARKWVFSPQTEKKVLAFSRQGRKIYLVYYVRCAQSYMGIAEYNGILIGNNYSKPTASIKWLYTTPIARTQIKQMTNAYNDNRPLHESEDGVIIKQSIGEELMRIFAVFEFKPEKLSQKDAEKVKQTDDDANQK